MPGLTRPSLALALLGLALGAATTAACSSEPRPATAASACEDELVDVLKELMIVDESVVTDARSKNATAGTWSFRHVIENMTPAGTDPGDFALHWLEQWATVKTMNGSPLDAEPRDVELNNIIICPCKKWKR